MDDRERITATIEMLDIFAHYGVPGEKAGQLLKDANLITANFARMEKNEANIVASSMELIKLLKRCGVRREWIPALITEMNEVVERYNPKR